MNNFLILLILSLTLLSCQPEPRPINFGIDECDYCRMTIVDNQYAAELVNPNSKTFVFDAVECMLRYMNEQPEAEFPLVLVTDFNNPGQLIDGKKAFYIRSKELPSPMGMSITSVISESDAIILQNKHTGDIFNFQSLMENFPTFSPL